MTRQIKQHEESNVPAVSQDLFSTLRAQWESMLQDMEGLEKQLLETPWVQGISIFPHENRLQVRPFGHLPDKKWLQKGWREPFIRYEVNEPQRRLEVTAEVPGVTKDDVKLDVGPDHIRLEANGEHASYRAFLEPGMGLDADHAEATCKDGVLRVRIPLATRNGKRIRHIRID